MTVLAEIDRSALAAALAATAADGWLLYGFREANPIVGRILGVHGIGSRRLFVWIPRRGDPVAVVHRIELHGFRDFPGTVRPYASWQELHGLLAEVVGGRRVAMEVSPDNAVPYLDRVPAGVVELVRRLRGTVVSSATLITQFAARWSPHELEDHRAAAEAIAGIARRELTAAIRESGTLRECTLQQRVLDAFDAAGLVTHSSPIVAFGSHASYPHYEPTAGDDAVLQAGNVILLDLWAGRSATTVFADQTWMGFAGASLPDEVAQAWSAVREARDAVVDHLRHTATGRSVTGAELDDVARTLLSERGYAEVFLHRTGHSIDLELHGSGPNLDNFETRDTRELIPELGFSVEPGIYLEGRFGIRSEINVVLHADGPEVTPGVPQREIFLAE